MKSLIFFLVFFVCAVFFGLSMAFESPATEDLLDKLTTPQIVPTEIYVATTGSDLTGDGSEANPYGTIQHAVDLSMDGDIIILFDGVYSGPGNVDISWHDKGLEFRSFSGIKENCDIDCASSAGFIFHNSEVSIQRSLNFSDLTISGAMTAIYATGTLDIGDMPAVLLVTNNCLFRDGTTGIEVNNCKLEMNSTTVYGNSGTGVDGVFPFSMTTNDCVFRNNGTGILYWTVFAGGSDLVEINSTDIVSNGIGIRFWQEELETRMTDCRVDSSSTGSGIESHSDWGEDLILTNCSVSHNAENGIQCQDGHTNITALQCEISGNDFNGIEGNGALSLSQCNISNNLLDGIYVPDILNLLVFEISNCFITNNGRRGISILPQEYAPNIIIQNSDITDNDLEGLSVTSPFAQVVCDNTNFLRNGYTGISFLHEFKKRKPACFLEEGPVISINECIFADNESNGIGGRVWEPNCTASISKCLVYGNSTGIGLYLATTTGTSHLLISESTIVQNSRGLYSKTDELILENLIIVGNEWESVVLEDVETLSVMCTDIFNNGGGDWIGPLAGFSNIHGNISEDPQFCGAADPDSPFSINLYSPCSDTASPFCGLIGAFAVNCHYHIYPSDVGPGADILPARNILYPNSPNPFNPRTTIGFDLHQPGSVELAVFDLSGKLIKVLAEDFMGAGHHEVIWNGRDSHDRPVAGGVYFFRLMAGGFEDTKRMTLLK